MRLDGEQTMLRIYLRNTDRYRGLSVVDTLVDRARARACMIPPHCEANSRFVSSWMGQASMSARRAMHGPTFFDPMSATIPVCATRRNGIRNCCNTSSIITAV
jgi:hypothetical protein